MNMKRVFVLAFMAALCVSAFSQLLWRVSGPGDKPSYVFGTHHFTPASFLDSIPGFAEAINSVDCVIVEIESDSLNTPKVTNKMVRAMMVPADSSLSSLYTEEEYALVSEVVNRRLKELGVTIEFLDRMKPNAIATQMEAARAIRQFKTFDTNAMIDGEVQRRAKAMGKPCISLETADFQIDLLLGAPISSQARDLLDLCRHDNESDSLSIELTQAYQRQDLEAVNEIMFEPALGNGDDYEDLLYGRNERWVPIMASKMLEGGVMVAVGAGHLLGDRGLLQLLRNIGCTVEAVR